MGVQVYQSWHDSASYVALMRKAALQILPDQRFSRSNLFDAILFNYDSAIFNGLCRHRQYPIGTEYGGVLLHIRLTSPVTVPDTILKRISR